MLNGNKPNKPGDAANLVWSQFIRYCAEMNHGEIERLKIQDGLPVMAELAVRKIRFGP
jgi:hypothetical protein